MDFGLPHRLREAIDETYRRSVVEKGLLKKETNDKQKTEEKQKTTPPQKMIQNQHKEAPVRSKDSIEYIKWSSTRIAAAPPMTSLRRLLWVVKKRREKKRREKKRREKNRREAERAWRTRRPTRANTLPS